MVFFPGLQAKTSSRCPRRLSAEWLTTLFSKFSFNAILKSPFMQIRGVLFDFMGTTANEKDPDMIHHCFVQSFRDHGVDISDEIIRMNRGMDKKEMILFILNQYNQSDLLLHGIVNSFSSSLKNNLDNFATNKDTREVIRFLKGKNIVTGLGTGFPKDVFTLIFNHLEWETVGFDYIGIAEETGKGRPHPDMILDMLKKFNLQKEQFLKVGDTVADILEGKNAGVKTAAIQSGTQDEKEIIKQHPDFIIHHLGELMDIVGF